MNDLGATLPFLGTVMGLQLVGEASLETASVGTALLHEDQASSRSGSSTFSSTHAIASSAVRMVRTSVTIVRENERKAMEIDRLPVNSCPLS